jgi:hypothetical protein
MENRSKSKNKSKRMLSMVVDRYKEYMKLQMELFVEAEDEERQVIERYEVIKLDKGTGCKDVAKTGDFIIIDDDGNDGGNDEGNDGRNDDGNDGGEDDGNDGGEDDGGEDGGNDGGEDKKVKVVCGKLKVPGEYIGKRGSGKSAQYIFNVCLNGKWTEMHGTEYETVAGEERSKKWKQSIKMQDSKQHTTIGDYLKHIEGGIV